MRLRTAAVQEEVAPNLIPMVDIMFLLLLFFMLSADMGQRNLEDVRLPGAQMATDDQEAASEDERLTINVFHDPKVTCPAYAGKRVCREDRHWKTGIRGQEFHDIPTLAAYLKTQAPREAKDPRRSSRRVMIRSDAAAPSGLAQRAMDACIEAGLYRLEVGAALPPGAKAKP
jgi:biopolymer transport protein ExbD